SGVDSGVRISSAARSQTELDVRFSSSRSGVCILPVHLAEPAESRQARRWLLARRRVDLYRNQDARFSRHARDAGSERGINPALLAFVLFMRNTRRVPTTVSQLTDRLLASYAEAGGINHLDGKNLPSNRAVALITVDLLRLLFPGFFHEKPIHSSEIKAET